MLRFNSVACLAWVVAAAFGTSTLAAQATITVPEGLLTEGETITIEYSDPTKPNETVVIEADDAGFPTTTIVEIEIVLDENGEGTATWRVPAWRSASFNGPDALQKTRFIKRATPAPGQIAPGVEVVAADVTQRTRLRAISS